MIRSVVILTLLLTVTGIGAVPALAAAADAVAQPTVAQASASPAPPAGPQSRGGAGASLPPSTSPGRFGHLPIIDIISVFTQPQFYSNGPLNADGQPTVNALKNSGTGYDPLDVGGTIRLPLTPGIYASFDRVVGGPLSAANARVTSAATATGIQPYQYNSFSRDVVLQYRVDEQFNRFTSEQALVFRHRIVGGVNTSATPFLPTISSNEAHYGYVGVSYTSSPIRQLLNSFFTFAFNADAQNVDHHVACLLTPFNGVAATCPKGNKTGTIDENSRQNRWWGTDQYVALTVPVDRRHGFSLSAQNRRGALTFFENIPFPYLCSTSQTYIATKRFNPVVSLSLRVRDQWAVPAGAPYVKPNAQHNGTIDVIGSFHLDPNLLLR